MWSNGLSDRCLGAHQLAKRVTAHRRRQYVSRTSQLANETVWPFPPNPSASARVDASRGISSP